jgi:predicted nuclease of restriction endonuclease-like (RecB) superfamily
LPPNDRPVSDFDGRRKGGVTALAQKGHEIGQPSDLLEDPLVLEFAGLRHDERFRESDLENALISKLQQFLLELGKGFAFMGRQQRITRIGRRAAARAAPD